MSWATPQDYNEAIQVPAVNFSDPDLKSGSVDTNNLGLPRAISGGFASVYRVRSNNKDWAVRCFLREFADQKKRYEAISAHLKSVNLPYTVGFEFLAQGIRVNGNWFPILKMEWVQGKLLNRYVEENLKNPAALQNLANRWVTMIKDLQAANIAHGDLQHGNILVVGDDFRLIDYDGMYVPSLIGESSHEVGHRNYQHPNRTELDFGPTIDNFASWVIYVSLMALSLDPSLWNKVRAGDEYLLFCREDFQEPINSTALGLLSKHTNQQLYSLASFFQSLLYTPPSNIPSLTSKLQNTSISVQNNSPISAKPGKPSWLNDHLTKSSSPASSVISDINSSQNATWVLDFIASPIALKNKILEVNVLKPRITLITATFVSAVILLFYFISVVPVAIAATFFATVLIITFLLIRGFYRDDPVIIRVQGMLLNKREGEKQLKKFQQRIKAREYNKNEILKKQKSEVKNIDSRLSKLQAEERHKKAVFTTKLTQSQISINAKRQKINQEEIEELSRIKDSIGYEVARLSRNINSLVTSETNELANTLRRQQEEAIRNHLLKRPIDDATIPGVGPALKSRLRSAGIWTAADVEYWRVINVTGIGQDKANALLGWRNHLASFAKTPKSLTPFEIQIIKNKYQSQKLQLEKQKLATEQKLDQEKANLKSRTVQRLNEIENEFNQIKAATDREIQALSKYYSQQYAILSQEQLKIINKAKDQTEKIINDINQLKRKMGEQHWQLGKINRDLSAYKNVTIKTYLKRILGLRFSSK